MISLILCICMLYISHTRKTYSGFRQWTISSVVNFFGLLFLSLRGVIPDFYSVVVANTLIVGGYGFVAYGIEIFFGHKGRKWLFVALGALVFVAFSYFTYSSPNVTARIVSITIILTILCTYCAYIIYRFPQKTQHVHNGLLTAVFSFQAIWSIFRIIPTVFFDDPIMDYMQAPAIHGITVVIYFGGNIFITIGLIIMNFQRVEIELLDSMNEIKILRGIIPICSSCKKIRDDKGLWEQVEIYIREHSDAVFSHSICPDCFKQLYPEYCDDDDK